MVVHIYVHVNFDVQSVLLMNTHVGLGKLSQGMSTALAVEKTSKRGGKIINVAAEKGKLIVD